MVEPLELLARDDRWALGCGDGAIFAPAEPLWLDVPGFWDAATVYQTPVAPLFTVTVLDEEGRELGVKLQSRRWTPAELTLEYRFSNGVTASEVRTVHPGGVFVSEWRLRALRNARVQLVAWTAQPDAVAAALGADWRGAIAIRRPAQDHDGRSTPMTVELSTHGAPTSWGVYVAVGAPPAPRWSLTQFPERWRGDGLPRELRGARDAAGGTLLAAVHRACVVGGNGASATFAMRVVPSQPALAPAAAPSAAVGRQGTLGGVSRRRWSALLERGPVLRCSDPYIETCYWYRWSGVWLNAITTPAGAYREPALCEGPGALHVPRAAAIASAVRELRWLDDPATARGALRTFLARQAQDGALPARVPLDPAAAAGWEPAPWGDAILALDAAAPDDAFASEAYRPLARYAEWLIRERDRDATGMFDATADPAAREASPRFAGRPLGSPLKAVDATVWAYTLFRALERLAPRAGAPDGALRWRTFAERSLRAVRERMWDAAEGLFRDVDPASGERSAVRAANGFLVYGTDLANAEHLAGLERNLFDPDRFWTAFPVPSVSLDDLSFTPYSDRGGEGEAAPRGGRTIPFITSGVIESAARAAVAYAPHIRRNVAQLLHRFVRLLFHEGDLGRPNCYPDYNPFTGHPSLVAGADQHLLGAINDLIIQYVVGIRPHAQGITIDPFPFGLDHVELRGVKTRGVELDVVVSGERVTVTADGVKREERLGTRMEL